MLLKNKLYILLFSLALPLAVISQTSGNFNPVTLEGRIVRNEKGGFISEISVNIAKGYYLYATAPKSMAYTLANVDIQLPETIKRKGKLIKPNPVPDPEDPKIGIYTGEVRFLQPISDSTGEPITCIVKYQYCNSTGCSLPIERTVIINQAPVHPFSLSVIYKQPINDTMRFRYRDPDGQEKSVRFPIVNGTGTFKGETCQPFWNWFGATRFKNNGGFLMGEANMTLYLDTANYGKKVEGSPWDEEYNFTYKPFGQEEEKISRRFIDEYIRMREIYGSNPGGHREDSLNYLYGQYEYYKRLKDKNYIEKNPDSDVSLALARNMFHSGIAYEEILGVYNLLSPRQKESIIGKELHHKVMAAKATGVGSVSPDFSLQDSTGRAHNLSDYRGKYVLIDFWKYGCIPCIQQFPKLRELNAGYQSKGFEILGVFHCVFDGKEKNRQEWIQLMRKEHPTWTGLIDYSDEVCQAYGVEAFPSNFLLGPDGKVITCNIEPNQLSLWLEKTLGKPVSR